MCGIVGWIGGQSPERGVIDHAAEYLRHRGPDDRGADTGVGWGLAFRRLSIIDLSPMGHQPMFSPDRRYVLAFNGEIYNYVELRRELEQAGERFRGGSDTEVLLALLARHGIGGLPKLNGMFALAFIDTVERTFLLARDRLGVKPLFYTMQPGQIRFASELKALISWPDTQKTVESSRIADYISAGYLDGPASVFVGYSKMEPGSVMRGSLDAVGQATIKRYWELALNDDPTARALTSSEGQQLEAMLADAVRIRLRSDVPVGLFLSGGIDSGLVAAAAAQVSGARILALTVGFDDADADETALAQTTAQHLGLTHRAIVQQPGSPADVDELAWYYDEPFGDPSALPFFALCRVAAQHATVYLSGDGGDEAFGGYRRYVESARHRRLIASASRVGSGLDQVARILPKLSVSRYRLQKLALRDEGCAVAFDGLPDDPMLSMILHPELRASLKRPDRQPWQHWSASRGMRSITARQQHSDYAMYLPDDVLTKVDRASMAHSNRGAVTFPGLPSGGMGRPAAARRAAQSPARKVAAAAPRRAVAAGGRGA